MLHPSPFVRLDVQLINDLRVQRSLTLDELAAAVGIHRQTLDIVLARGTCQSITAEQLALALGAFLHEIAVQLDETDVPQ